MARKKEMSQEEIDAVFKGSGGSRAADQPDLGSVAAFDLSHLDRIPKAQLRALHMVHENFVLNLASSLSAYLRSYVVLNLVSLEQISYAEFLEGLSFPSCIAYIGANPYEGTCVLEMNQTLVFNFLEILMGSKGRPVVPMQRKITEIEKTILQTLLRVVLVDLREAWKSVADIEFAVQSLASEPQLAHVLSPAEAVIVIAVDVRVGDVTGLMNIAVPSIFIKRLKTNFEQLQSIRRTTVSTRDNHLIAELIQDVDLKFASFIEGGNIPTRTLVDMEAGDVLMFDAGADQPVITSVNGERKWQGRIATRKNKLVFEVQGVLESASA